MPIILNKGRLLLTVSNEPHADVLGELKDNGLLIKRYHTASTSIQFQGTVIISTPDGTFSYTHVSGTINK